MMFGYGVGRRASVPTSLGFFHLYLLLIITKQFLSLIDYLQVGIQLFTISTLKTQNGLNVLSYIMVLTPYHAYYQQSLSLSLSVRGIY